MSKLFAINLNRQEGYAQKEARKRLIRDRVTIVVVSLLLIVMTYYTVDNHNEMSHIIKDKKNQLDRIIAQIDSLQQVGQNVSKEDVIALARLDAERVLWTKKMRAIAELLPRETTVTGLELNRGVFKLRCVAPIQPEEKDFDVVAGYMNRLRMTPLFFEDIRKMQFAESKRFKLDRQELLDFTIKCEIARTSDKGRSSRSRTSTTKKSGGR